MSCRVVSCVNIRLYFEGTEEEVRNTSAQLAADLGAESGPLFWGAECEVDEVGIGGVVQVAVCELGLTHP